MTEKVDFNSYDELCEHIITNRALSGESRVRQRKLEDQPEHFLDINYKFAESSVIVIMFAGAYKADIEKNLPFYLGKGIKNSLNCSVLQIGDPSLYLNDVRLGWYCGDRSNHLQTNLTLLLRKLITYSGASRIIFFGGSGGGFASLYYGRKFDNSLCLVWNPQILIEEYDIAEYAVIENYSTTAFNSNRKQLRNFVCTDIISHYLDTAPKNNFVLYLQNVTDRHVQRDLKPLLNRLYPVEKLKLLKLDRGVTRMVNPNFLLHLTNWSKGHRPPPKNVLYTLIKKASSEHFKWNKNSFLNLLRKCENLAKIDIK